VALVAAGVVLVRGVARVGRREAGHVALALAIGGLIAGYTLVDKEGLRFANPLPYLVLIILPPAVVYALVLWRPARWRRAARCGPPRHGRRRRGDRRCVRARADGARARTRGGGLRHARVERRHRDAPAGPLLGERVGVRRLAGSVVVVTGVVVLSLSRPV
jgi:drug/metabolite transporter (DMT)-like permease